MPRGETTEIVNVFGRIGVLPKGTQFDYVELADVPGMVEANLVLGPAVVSKARIAKAYVRPLDEPTPAPPVVTFTADKTTVVSGQPVALAWYAPEASEIKLNGLGVTGPNGGQTVNPTVNPSKYTLSVKYDRYPDSVWPDVTREIAITVNPAQVQAVQVGYNVLANAGAGTMASGAGCKRYLVMENHDHAEWLAAQGHTVMYRKWLNNVVPTPADMVGLMYGARNPAIIYTGINEGEGGLGYNSPDQIRNHADWDRQVAAICRQRGSKYAGLTMAVGNMDFNNPDICLAVKDYYAPAYNAGEMFIDYHSYSPNMSHIYSGASRTILTGMARPGDRPRNTGRMALWANRLFNRYPFIQRGMATAMGAIPFTVPETWWYEERWRFFFAMCGFLPTGAGLGIVSGETGVDEGGVGGFPAHGATATDVINWIRRFIYLQSQPIVINGVSYPSHYRFGCLFQAGDTGTNPGQWGGYNVLPYTEAIMNSGIWRV